MFESSIYNHAASQGKNKATRIKGRKNFVHPELIPPHLQQASIVTMSSLEFSVLTGTRHDHLMTDIRKMLEEQGLNTSDFLETYVVEGDTYSYFNLQQAEVYDLLAGYSAPMRLKVIRRWHELEAKIKKPSYAFPTTLADALKLAGELEEKRTALTYAVKELEQKIAGDAEKVEFYNDIANTDELFNTGIVAKTLDTGKTKFLNYLRKYKIIMGTGYKRNLPYQQHLDAGRLDVKWVKATDRKTGEQFSKPVPLFTGKGMIWIKQFVEQNGRWGL
ncbi:phage antirepressor KilAC domain-containing protein [Pseudomonas sp. H1_D05]